MGHGVAGLLLTAIGGYWVLERASAHKGRLRQIGQCVGGLVILVSIVGVVCHVWCLAAGAGYCPVGKSGKGRFCPFMQSAPETSAAKSGNAAAP